jgi:hypothetical protein
MNMLLVPVLVIFDAAFRPLEVLVGASSHQAVETIFRGFSPVVVFHSEAVTWNKGHDEGEIRKILIYS